MRHWQDLHALRRCHHVDGHEWPFSRVYLYGLHARAPLKCHACAVLHLLRRHGDHEGHGPRRVYGSNLPSVAPVFVIGLYERGTEAGAVVPPPSEVNRLIDSSLCRAPLRAFVGGQPAVSRPSAGAGTAR
jgi:hypothetical protein